MYTSLPAKCTSGAPVPNVDLCNCLRTFPCLIRKVILSPLTNIIPGIPLFLSGALIVDASTSDISLSVTSKSFANLNGALSPKRL